MMFCLATLQIGGTNVFTPAFDAEEVCRLVDAERVTQAFLFGPMIDAVVDGEHRRASTTCPRCGSSPTPRSGTR